MVENFRRSYQELEAVRRTDIMGIYGSTHVVESEYRNSDFRMAKQLSENYGEHLHTKDLTQEPERIDALEVNGKTYTASYFGEQDISMVKGYKTRKFWRLEDAYEDFKELPTPREILPADYSRNPVLFPAIRPAGTSEFIGDNPALDAQFTAAMQRLQVPQ